MLDKRNTSCHLSDYSEITVARRGIVVVYIGRAMKGESPVVREKRLQGNPSSWNERKTCPQLFHRFRFFEEPEVESFSRLNRWIVLLGPGKKSDS